MQNRIKTVVLILLTMIPWVYLSAQVAEESNPQLSLSLELVNPATGGRYRSPYVAIWLETPEGEAVTTIEVWYERSRWLPDLSQWWRKLGSQGTSQYDAVSGATRRADTYEVEWTGTTIDGQTLPPGEYHLWVEVVREHGGHDRVRVPVDLGMPGSKASATGQSELGLVEVTVY